ncbi:MAG: hypothetical protein U1F57_11635 [bacterium]
MSISHRPSPQSTDIVLGNFNGRTYSLRQSGGRDAEVLEPTERVEIVKSDAGGQNQSLNEVETRQALAALGMRALPRSGRTRSLLDYVASIRQAQAASSNHNVHEVISQYKIIILKALLANVTPDIDALVSYSVKANPNFQRMPRERQELIRNNTRQYIQGLMNGEDDVLAILQYYQRSAAGEDVPPPISAFRNLRRAQDARLERATEHMVRAMERLQEAQADIVRQMGQYAANPQPTSGTNSRR